MADHPRAALLGAQDRQCAEQAAEEPTAARGRDSAASPIGLVKPEAVVLERGDAAEGMVREMGRRFQRAGRHRREAIIGALLLGRRQPTRRSIAVSARPPGNWP